MCRRRAPIGPLRAGLLPINHGSAEISGAEPPTQPILFLAFLQPSPSSVRAAAAPSRRDRPQRWQTTLGGSAAHDVAPGRASAASAARLRGGEPRRGLAAGTGVSGARQGPTVAPCGGSPARAAGAPPTLAPTDACPHLRRCRVVREAVDGSSRGVSTLAGTAVPNPSPSQPAGRPRGRSAAPRHPLPCRRRTPTRPPRAAASLAPHRSQAAHEVCGQHPEDHQGDEDGGGQQDAVGAGGGVGGWGGAPARARVPGRAALMCCGAAARVPGGAALVCCRTWQDSGRGREPGACRFVLFSISREW